MNGDEDPQPVRHIKDRTPIALNRDRASCQTLRSRRSKGHDKPQVDPFDFFPQPPSAYLDLTGVWPLVQSPLASRLEFEMLDRVGHGDALAVDACLYERAVEEKACRLQQTGDLHCLLDLPASRQLT